MFCNYVRLQFYGLDIVNKLTYQNRPFRIFSVGVGAFVIGLSFLVCVTGVNLTASSLRLSFVYPAKKKRTT